MENREKRKKMQEYSRFLYKDFSNKSNVNIAFSCKGMEYEVSVTFIKKSYKVSNITEERKRFSFSSSSTEKKIEETIKQIYNYDNIRK